MQAVTRDQLIADVERRLNLVFGTNRKPMTLADVRIELSESCDALAALVREQDYDDGYFSRTEVLQVEAGQGSIDLSLLSRPFLDLERVALVTSPTEQTTLRHAAKGSWLAGGVASSSWSQTTPVYRLVGNTIEFYPMPAAGAVVGITYAAGLGTGPDENWSTHMMPGWRRWIVADVCRKHSIADNKPGNVQQFARERDDAERIVLTGGNRDKGSVRTIEDLVGDPNHLWWM